MRAGRFRRHGGPEVWRSADLPVPDRRARRGAGAGQRRRPQPHRFVDAAGVAGDDSAACRTYRAATSCGDRQRVWAPERRRRRSGGVAMGTRVVVNPGLTCGRCRACLGGQDNLCAAFRMVGEHTRGGMAEYVVVPAANVVPAPAALLSDAELAAVAHHVHDRLADAGGQGAGAARRDGAGAGRGLGRGRGRHPDRQAVRRAGHRRRLHRAQARAAPRALGADDTIDYVSEELVAGGASA